MDSHQYLKHISSEIELIFDIWAIENSILRSSTFLGFNVRCLVTVSVLWLFTTVLWVGQQCVIVVFPDHTHLFATLTTQPYSIIAVYRVNDV